MKFFCHPKYNGKPTCGYDYAIGIIDQDLVTKKNYTNDHYAKESIFNTLYMAYDAEIAKKAIGSDV